MYWMDTVGEFKIPVDAHFHEVIVPTVDTVRYSFLLQKATEHRQPMMFVGIIACPLLRTVRLLVPAVLHHNVVPDAIPGLFYGSVP